MTTKVAILYSKSLFAAGIDSRLRNIHDMDTIRIDASDDDALQKLDTFVPNVLIFDSNDRKPVCEVIILHALSQYPAIRVISLNVNSEEINIFWREGKTVLSNDELIAVIRSNYPGSTKTESE